MIIRYYNICYILYDIDMKQGFKGLKQGQLLAPRQMAKL